MANIFNIKITAVDNASKVVNKVNKSVSKIFAPYDKAKQSAGNLFKSLGKNDLIARPTAMLNKMGGAVNNLSNSFGVADDSILGATLNIGKNLMSIGGPLGVIAGTAGITAVAVNAVGVKMGTMGLEVARTAKSLGMTTDELQAYRGAAKMAGLSTDAMDNSMASLGTTLQDAAAGRNMQVAAMLTQMGVGIKRNKDGVVDSVAAFRDLADVIGRITDPNIQKKMADMLGLGDMLPLIREGTAALDNYITAARRVGLVQNKEIIEQNEAAGKSWNHLKASVDGLGTSLGNLVSKYADVEGMSKWVDSLAKGPAGLLQKKSSSATQTPTERMVAMNSDVYTTPFMQQFRANQAAAAGGAASGPIGIRNNNPGNLRSWAGAGSNGGFATFPSAGAGLTAAAKNLIGYQDKYGISTIDGIVNRWAPASDKNNVPGYIGDVSKRTGFGANENLDMHDPKVLAPLLSSIVSHENGQNPYDPQVIAQAVAQAIKETQSSQPIELKVEGMPAGMSIKAVRGLGQVNTGMTMAAGGAS